MGYGALIKNEDKTELREVLFHQVCAAIEDADVVDSVREQIPDYIDVLVENGVPEYMLAMLAEGKHIDIFCNECFGSPCCNLNDPIALTWKDVQRISKGFGISNKKVIKKYLLPHSVDKYPGIQYKIKSVVPCQWNDPETFGCNIYGFRPNVCRAYPITPGKENDGNFGMGVASYCNVAFNMMKQEVIVIVIRENLKALFPKEYEEINKIVAESLPSHEELMKMPQFQRWKLLTDANEKMGEMLTEVAEKEYDA